MFQDIFYSNLIVIIVLCNGQPDGVAAIWQEYCLVWVQATSSHSGVPLVEVFVLTQSWFSRVAAAVDG